MPDGTCVHVTCMCTRDFVCLPWTFHGAWCQGQTSTLCIPRDLNNVLGSPRPLDNLAFPSQASHFKKSDPSVLPFTCGHFGVVIGKWS